MPARAGAQRLGIAVADVGPQRLHPGPVRRRATRLPAATPEHGGATRLRVGRELVGEPALADPGLAGEEHEPAAARIARRRTPPGCSRSSRSRPTNTPAARLPGWSPRSGRLDAPGGVEPRILVEDRPLELLQRPARLDAELVEQGAPGVLVGSERLGLPPGPVERQHQLTTEALAERMLGDQPLELADHLRMAPALEIGLESLLDDTRAAARRAARSRPARSLVRDVRERPAAPEAERRVEGRRSRVPWSPAPRASAPRQERCGPIGIELVGRHLEHVAARRGCGRRSSGRSALRRRETCA